MNVNIHRFKFAVVVVLRDFWRRDWRRPKGGPDTFRCVHSGSKDEAA